MSFHRCTLLSFTWYSELPKYILDYSATFCHVFNAQMVHHGKNDYPPPPLDIYSQHSFYAHQDSAFKLGINCSRSPNYVQTKSCKVGLPLLPCSRFKLTSKHSALNEHEMQVGATNADTSKQCTLTFEVYPWSWSESRCALPVTLGDEPSILDVSLDVSLGQTPHVCHPCCRIAKLW